MSPALAILLLLGSPPALVAAQGAERGDRWRVEVSPGRCILTRGTEPAATMLAVDALAGGDAYNLLLMDVASTVRPADGAPVTIAFTGVDADFRRNGTVSAFPKGRALTVQGADEAVLSALANASSVSFAVKSGASAPHPVPGAAKAVAAFRRCLADQLVEWGADPAQFAPGGAPPQALKHRDYWFTPPQLLALNWKGDRLDASFRLAVDTQGRIASCTALSETHATLQKDACKPVLGRPLFRPARAPDGSPVQGAATFNIKLFRAAR